MTTPDSELLREFARERSEKVFAALVSRHVDLVYSAALRQVRSPQLAEDVAQTVFIDLSQNADKLAPDTILTAWLYRVTRRAAIDVVRSESRRQFREKIAVELSNMNSPDTHWKEIEPLLDEAMDTLDETDRTSILLRYFENKNLREVGERLGTSDDAAQKRVSRAVERLREFFSKRGVTIGASGLVVAISGNAIQAAPIGFALTISSALAGTTLASAATATAIKTIAMTTLQKSLITAAIVAAVGAGIYEAREASDLRKQVESLKQQQQSAPADQLQQLASERDNARRQLADLREENERLNRNSAELIRLRGEVGLLRSRLANSGLGQNSTNQLSTADHYLSHKLAIQQMQSVAIGLVFCAQENNWQFPTNFEQLKSGLEKIGKDWLLSTNHFIEPHLRKGHLQLDAFEFINTEVFAKPLRKSPGGDVAILREKIPYQTPDGKWERVYGMSSGSAETIISEDGNFENWEKEHSSISPSNR
jgi:RNA polymerase sigma factor (sigma-70 family)